MIYFVLDAESTSGFAQQIHDAACELADGVRLIQYSQLATLAEFPVGTYVFLGLSASWPERIRRLVPIETRLLDSGSTVWNGPSRFLNCDGPLEMARRLCPELELKPALDVYEGPAVLRATSPWSFVETPVLEAQADYEEALLEWILDCTKPETIHRVSVSALSGPDWILSGFRVGAEVVPISYRRLGIGSARAKTEPPTFETWMADAVRTKLDESQTQFAQVDFLVEGSEVRLWRVNDLARSLFDEPRPGPENWARIFGLIRKEAISAGDSPPVKAF